MTVTQALDCHTVSGPVWPCGVCDSTQTILRGCQTGPVYQEPGMALDQRCYQSTIRKTQQIRSAGNSKF